MSGETIQKHGSGFLSFFGVKGAQRIQTLGSEVIPTIGVEHFFAAADLEVVVATQAGLSAVDSGVNITVPSNESWRLWDLSFRATQITVASAAYITMVLAPPIGGQVSLREPSRFVSTALTSNYRDGIFLPQPVVLAAGSVLGAVIMEQPAAGTINLNLYALIQRFST